MDSSPHDEIKLNGTWQVDTAIAALNVMGYPPAENILLTFRTIQKELHEAIAIDQPERLSLSMRGETTGAMKSDIIIGLEKLSTSAELSEQRVAAQALYEVITGTGKTL